MLKKFTKKQQEHIDKEIKKRIKEHASLHLLEKASFFGSEFKKHASTALMAAFGFLIALTWRDFISLLVNETIATPSIEKHPYLAALYTAVIITIIGIIGIALVAKWAKSNKNKK